MIPYLLPARWIGYNATSIAYVLTNAKATVLSLQTVPFQRRWVDALQKTELKREVAGTSRIEGAEFTERELEAAMAESPDDLLTRSQRQAHAATLTYRWIATIPPDRSINDALIREIHRRIVTGADDDHVPPGELRGEDQNVTFGFPRHRGAGGGEECATAIRALARAIADDFPTHDPMVQALAAHYHVAAMHPFLDGNGRTARALEALMLQRAGLRDTAFIAMSNYYYDEKNAYLQALADVRQAQGDLTPYLLFALKGIEQQSRRLLKEIQRAISKELYRNLMYDLFNRLQSPRKRVIAKRQIELLKVLLAQDSIRWSELFQRSLPLYSALQNANKALTRDVNHLIGLRMITAARQPDNDYELRVRLEWPTEVTETEFFRQSNNMPRAKSFTVQP